MSVKKLPPYGKTFVQHDDELPLAWLYFGPGAWGAMKQNDDKQRTIILPPDDDPSIYDWRFLRNQIVVAYALGQTELKYRRKLALCLLYGGCERVHVFLPKQPQITEYTHLTITDLDIQPHEHYYR